MLRNLFYNCCPIKKNISVVHDNVERLCRYGSIFNGRKIVVIKTGEAMGEALENPDVIRPLFDSLSNVEFILWPNDPMLSEAAGFIETLSLLESKREDEITFYAHTKGVSHFSTHQTTVKQWRNRMYHECLSQPERIDEIMKSHPACGCFFFFPKNKAHRAWPWHFAGTFWWVNHARLFSSDWKNVAPHRSGPEIYLSRMFEHYEVNRLFPPPSETDPHTCEINPHTFYSKTFGLFLCNRCGEMNILLIEKRIRCPKCSGNLKFIKNSDMFH